MELQRLLESGEVLVFDQENFEGRAQLITDDIPTLGDFSVASLRIGPKTGVTVFSERDYQGVSQELSAELPSLVGSKLQDKRPKSLKVWSAAGQPFTGYWAIEVTQGRYLSVRLDENGVGVLTTSPAVFESEEFRIEHRGDTRLGRQKVSFSVHSTHTEMKIPAIKPPPMTIIDLQDVTLVDEDAEGFRKFSLLTRDNRWICYNPEKDRFRKTTVDKDRTIFCRAIKIAEDETQVGELIQGEIALYEQINYWGKAWIFYTDYADFGRVLDLNDEVSSIRLGPLTGATIYREAQFSADDPKAGKQDVVFNLPSLIKEQVGEDQISSLDLWRIVSPGDCGISVKTCLSQDFRGVGEKFEEYSAYRTTLRLPPIVDSVDVWATDETDIEVDNQIYHVDEDYAVTLKPNLVRCIVITTDAVVASEGETPRGSLSAPGLKIRANTMLPHERMIVFPHREVHTRLANLADGELWDASFKDRDGQLKHVIKDRSPRRKGDIDNAQRMITKIMSTVKYSQDAAGAWEQGVSPEGLQGKYWALDFLTYRVKAKTLYVREGPQVNLKPIGYLNKHDIVEALGFNEDASWVHIRRSKDGLTGWSSSKYLDKIDTPYTGDQYRVTAKGLHIRQGPEKDSRSVGYLGCDEVVTAIGVNREGTWRLIRRSDGLTGWSSTRYLELVQPPPPSAPLKVATERGFAPERDALRPATPPSPVVPLPNTVMFHEMSQEEVQALLEIAKSPDTDLAQASFFKAMFKAIKSAVSLVVTEIEKGVAIIIKLVDDVIKWVVDTVEKIVSFVEAVFEKIGAVIEEIVKWLRFLFDWDDILQTRDMLRDVFIKVLDYLSGTFVEQAKDRVGSFVEDQAERVEDLFDQAILALGGDPDADSGGPGFFSSIMSSIEESKILDVVEWILSKIASISQVDIGSLFEKLLEALGLVDHKEEPESEEDRILRDFWENTIVKELKTIAKIPDDLFAVVDTFMKNADKPLLALAKLLELFRDQLVGLIHVGGDIILALLDLVAYLIKKLKIILSEDIRIPFISDLLEWLGLPGTLGFSILDVATLILAIPMTILSKVLYHQSPHIDVPALALQTASGVQQFFNILSGVCGYVGGLINMGLDAIPEKDEVGKAGENKGSPVESFFEIFSFACALGGWISSWRTFAMPDPDEPDPSEQEENWDYGIFAYEGFLILLDLLSLGFLAKYTGKIERFKRGVPITVGIASLLGVIHAGLFLWKGIAIQESFGDIVLNILPTFSEILSFLRLPQLYSTPTLLIMEIFDGAAAYVPYFVMLQNVYL